MPPTLTWSSERSIRIATDDPLACWRALRASGLPGLVDVTPGFGSVQVEFEVVGLDDARVEDELRALLERTSEVGNTTEPRSHTLPVCYDPALAPDLSRVAELAGLSVRQVIERHASGSYRVEVIGFSPGFGYLSGLDASLHTPRLDSPRARIPAGSVGIAGEHTGAYPQATAGGWNLIGRTPAPLFDTQRDPPALLRLGDSVRFEPIDRSTFDRLSEGR